MDRDLIIADDLASRIEAVMQSSQDPKSVFEAAGLTRVDLLQEAEHFSREDREALWRYVCSQRPPGIHKIREQHDRVVAAWKPLGVSAEVARSILDFLAFSFPPLPGIGKKDGKLVATFSWEFSEQDVGILGCLASGVAAMLSNGAVSSVMSAAALVVSTYATHKDVFPNNEAEQADAMILLALRKNARPMTLLQLQKALAAIGVEVRASILATKLDALAAVRVLTKASTGKPEAWAVVEST